MANIFAKKLATMFFTQSQVQKPVSGGLFLAVAHRADVGIDRLSACFGLALLDFGLFLLGLGFGFGRLLGS